MMRIRELFNDVDDAIIDFALIAFDIEHMRCARHSRVNCAHEMHIDVHDDHVRDDDYVQRVMIDNRIVRRAQRVIETMS